MKSNYAALMWAVGKFDFFDEIYLFAIGSPKSEIKEYARSFGVSPCDEMVSIDGAEIYKVEFEREKLHLTPEQLDQAEAQALGVHSNRSEGGELFDIPDVSKMMIDGKEYIAVKKGALNKLNSNPQWSGEGLPPVGCECEISIDMPNHEYWQPCKVEHYKNDKVWASWSDKGRLDSVFHVNCCKFRPIETPWQKKEREKQSVIDECVSAACKNGLVMEDLETVLSFYYDHGFIVNPFAKD